MHTRLAAPVFLSPAGNLDALFVAATDNEARVGMALNLAGEADVPVQFLEKVGRIDDKLAVLCGRERARIGFANRPDEAKYAMRGLQPIDPPVFGCSLRTVGR